MKNSMSLSKWYHNTGTEHKKKRILEKLGIRKYFKKFKWHYKIPENSIEEIQTEILEDLLEDFAYKVDPELNVIGVLRFMTDEKIKERLETGRDIIIDPMIKIRDIKDAADFDNLAKQATIYSLDFGPFNKSKDENIHDEYFKCACNTTKGKFNLGNICPKCHKEVKTIEYPIDRMGWIHLGGFKILTFIGYLHLCKIIGPDNTKTLLGYRIKYDKKKERSNNRKQINKILKPFKNSELYYNIENLFDTVLRAADYAKKKNRIDFFLKNKDSMFTSYIPVISTAFRRYLHGSSFDVSKVFTSSLNSRYTNLVDNVQKLLIYKNNSRRETFYMNLNREYRDTTMYIFNNIMGGKNCKERYIKNNVTASRQNNTIMAVIAPVSTIRPDQTIVSYNMFVALFSERIEEYCIKKGVPYQTIIQIIHLDVPLTDEHKKILEDFLKENRCIGWLNRQPTMKFSSNIFVEIIALNDWNVMQINPVICTAVLGDFDGDAPSMKGIGVKGLIDIKSFFYMNMFTHNKDYRGKLDIISMPINDMGILNAFSVPNREMNRVEKIEVGYNTEVTYAEDGEILDLKVKKGTKKIDFGYEIKEPERTELDGLYIVR